MDLGTAIIGLVAVVLCIIPLLFLARGRKQKEKDLLSGLQSIADTHNSKISEYAFGPSFAIGIDHSAGNVFFFKKHKNGVANQFIPLSKVHRCRANLVRYASNPKGQPDGPIEKLELVFVPVEPTQKVEPFEFYSQNDHFMMNDEIHIITKWETIINERISTLEY